MTAIIVFAALIIANVAYTIYDNRRAESAQMMDNYYRVEYKKSYELEKEINAAKATNL